MSCVHTPERQLLVQGELGLALREGLQVDGTGLSVTSGWASQYAACTTQSFDVAEEVMAQLSL
jgi:hypothetical protein